MIRVGIVGTGYTIGIAKMHIGAYKRLPNAQITAVYDILPERAQEYIDRMELHEAKACASYEELLSLADAVSICTPNVTHVELAVQALKAGKHVLCEKPFAPDAEVCLPAVEYAELSQKVCMIGLCYRYIPAFMYMKKLIDDGMLGEVFYVRQSQGGNRIASPEVKREWRMQKSLSGPGAIADFGSHMLDITDWLLREHCGAICEVQCMEGTFVPMRREIGSEKLSAVTNGDVAVFNARFEKGPLASFTASRIGSHHTMEIYGSGGYLGFDGKDPFSVTIHKKDIHGSYEDKPQTVPVPEELYMADEQTPKLPFQINFYLQAKKFLETIEAGAQAEADFARGLYIQQLIDAVQLSADTGEMIKLSES